MSVARQIDRVSICLFTGRFVWNELARCTCEHQGVGHPFHIPFRPLQRFDSGVEVEEVGFDGFDNATLIVDGRNRYRG